MKHHFIGIFAITLIFVSSQQAQAQRRGSLRYSAPRAQINPVYTGRSTPYTGQMTPAYTGRSTPYTGQTTPVYTGQSAPVRYQRPANMPSIGDRVTTLPIHNRRAYYPGGSCYYANGFYYQDYYQDSYESAPPTGQSSGETGGSQPLPPLDNSKSYEVVIPAVGTVIDELPVGATEVKRGLYTFRDVYYRPAYDEGVVKYVVSNP